MGGAFFGVEQTRPKSSLIHNNNICRRGDKSGFFVKYWFTAIDAVDLDKFLWRRSEIRNNPSLKGHYKRMCWFLQSFLGLVISGKILNLASSCLIDVPVKETDCCLLNPLSRMSCPWEFIIKAWSQHFQASSSWVPFESGGEYRRHLNEIAEFVIDFPDSLSRRRIEMKSTNQEYALSWFLSHIRLSS